MKNLIIGTFTLCMAIGMKAQNTDSVLKSIENHNKELQATRKSHEASELEIKTGNNLEDLSVEYSPFYRKGANGMASSELVVKQGFDFPTLYAARRKSGKLQQNMLDLQYLALRREILLEAKRNCLDLIFAEKEKALLEMRRSNADELLRLYEKKMEAGDATAIEMNKIKLECMGISTEMARNEAARSMYMQSLVALNGNEPLSFNEKEYPKEITEDSYESVIEKNLSVDLELRMAQAATEVSRQEIKVSKQKVIPKFEVGYRRNTEMKEASHGFLVGASIPVFSSRNKVKAAKAQFAASQMQQESIRIQTESRIRSEYEEMKKLKSTLQTYDIRLMYSTLEILRKAVEGGELSLTEYYTEADGIYRKLQEYIEVENQYYKATASLHKNDL